MKVKNIWALVHNLVPSQNSEAPMNGVIGASSLVDEEKKSEDMEMIDSRASAAFRPPYSDKPAGQKVNEMDLDGFMDP